MSENTSTVERAEVTDQVEAKPAPKKRRAAKKSTAKATPKKPGRKVQPKPAKAVIVKALNDWRDEHDGNAPSSADFWPARLLQYAKAADKPAERKAFEQQAAAHVKAGRPITPQVVSVYGSWVTALQAAGMKPRRQGRQSK